MNWKKRIKQQAERSRARRAKREADCLAVALQVEGGATPAAVARKRGVSNQAVHRMLVEAEVYREAAQ